MAKVTFNEKLMQFLAFILTLNYFCDAKELIFLLSNKYLTN